MTDSRDAAQKILALMDEFPSEPFSFERKQVEDKLECLIAKHTQQIDDEMDYSFNLGIEEGHSQGYEEAKNEYETRIQELEDELLELKDNLGQKLDDAFTEGYETARLEYGPK